MNLTQLNKVIQIVNYHEGLAAGIAKMWNLSRDSWGGDTRVMTAEQVKTKEANSDNIELYLAMDGEEVVGYCSLSEYKEDTGSLYIPLLNVRPDYHGHKIGKKLVLQALEKTVQLGWPRLDLYTWPGNTKAVPLYKKCGFFWEDRDDTTHLMNFIPQVLNTPLLKPVFANLDWYDSSVRQIEVKPDGVKKNGFSFYEYSWSNGNEMARVQFERTSRGMSLIETEDFLLEISMDDHEVIEQEELEFHIKIVNKGTSPLSIKASGNCVERMVYHLDCEQFVENESVITETFKVDKGEEPSIWRTHPSIGITVWINDIPCELKLGVFPVQPAKIEASYSGNLSFLNKESSIDLTVKNNLNQDAEFNITFPDDELVVLKRNTHRVKVPAGGRKTIDVPLTVKQHGFYHPELTIKAKKQDGTEIQFQQEISAAFKGLGQKFGGESKDHWHIFNGLSQVNVRKRDLLTTAGKNKKGKLNFAFMTPKLGKPYSIEFTKKKPSSVTWEIYDSAIELTTVLESAEMKGIQFTQKFQLCGDGIIQNWAEIENMGKLTHPDVAFCQPLYHEMEKTYFPLDDQVVYFSESRPLEYGDLNPDSITGNWYFNEGSREKIGVSWSAKSKAAPEGWQFLIEDSFGTMEPGMKQASGKITVAIGTFQHFEEFKAFAEETAIVKKMETASDLDFELDSIVARPEAEAGFTLKTNRNGYLNGTLNITAEGCELDSSCIALEDEKTVHSSSMELPELKPLTILSAEFIEDGMETSFHELVLSPSGKITAMAAEDGSLCADNGRISLKADPDFYPGVFSLMVNGQEWFDHSYPEMTAKSWWNPWAGGMKTAPDGINTFSLLKEKSSASEAVWLDGEGNKWSGLAITTEFTEHKEWKGVTYVQYYLMLPGIPVVATFAEVMADGGKLLKGETWVTDAFIGGDRLADLGIKTTNGHHTETYRAGVQELPLLLDAGSRISAHNRQEKLYVVSNVYADQIEGYTNKEVFQLLSRQMGLPESSGMKTAPLFLLFDERELPAELVTKLRKVQFLKENV
jgi:ribosomal protein S18 acetylase RimI-like enzyme